MLSTLRSLWAWTAITLLILAWAPLMAVVRLTDRDPARYRTGRWFRRLGWAMVAVNPAWSVVITGNLPRDPRRPYVFVGNHQSLADIPIVSRLPWDMKWLGKASIFKIPVLGWYMKLSRDLAVERDDRRSRVEVMGQARERLEGRVSVMIFPEGTRSRDGRVLRFSDGPFRLAIATGCPVIAIALDGSSDALPSDGWKFGPPLTVNLHVFDPIPVEGLEGSDARELSERVRAMIVSKIASWRAVDVSRVDAMVHAPVETESTAHS